MLATQERKEMCFKKNCRSLVLRPESASVEDGLLSEAAGYVCIVYNYGATICIDIYIYMHSFSA